MIEKPHGKYEIVNPLGLPKHFDKIVLYFLLYKLYREKSLNSCLLVTSRYEIAKNVFYDIKDFGKNRYARVLTSVRKWVAVFINFEGVFYEEEEYTIRTFGVIDEFTLIKKSGELRIRFNESYIKQLKETKFYKLIDFEQYKKLHKSSSARLYEVLVKTFEDRNEWAINIQLLAEKLTFAKQLGKDSYYPSDIIRYLKPGISEINKKTDLQIDFQYNKDTGVCIFKKLKKQKDTFIPAVKAKAEDKKKSKKQMAEYIKEFESLPVREQNQILDEIKKEPFLKFLPDQNSRIYAYMSREKNK